LLPRNRLKTLTALVGAEPITQAQTAPVQQLQFFLTESTWDAEQVTSRQIARLREEPLTAPHAAGALVIDETGVRKDGTHTAHVASHYLGTIVARSPMASSPSPVCGRTNGCTTRCRCAYPPARGAAGRWQAACGVSHQAAPSRSSPWRWCRQRVRRASPSRRWWPTVTTREHPEFTRTLWQAAIPFVLAIKPWEVVWTPSPAPPPPPPPPHRGGPRPQPPP